MLPVLKPFQLAQTVQNCIKVSKHPVNPIIHTVAGGLQKTDGCLAHAQHHVIQIELPQGAGKVANLDH